MERKNTVLLTIIAIATLLVTIIGSTFAYFASKIETTNNIPVSVETSNKQATFIATATGNINLNVEAYMMQQGDAGDGNNNTSNDEVIENDLVKIANLNVNLTASDSGNVSKCTYDIVFEWDKTNSSDFTAGDSGNSALETAKGKVTGTNESDKKIFPSKYYIRTEKGDGNFTETFKELTIAAHQTVSGAETGSPTTGDLFTEKNIDTFKCADSDCSKLYLKQREELSTTTNATVDYQFTIKFYNLKNNQTTLAGKNFVGHIKIDNVIC